MENNAGSVSADAETGGKQAHVDNMRVVYNHADACMANSPIEGGENFIGACQQSMMTMEGAKRKHQETTACSTTNDHPALLADKKPEENSVHKPIPAKRSYDNTIGNVQVLQPNYSSLNHLLTYESDQSDEYDENTTVIYNNSNQLDAQLDEPPNQPVYENRHREISDAVQQFGELNIDDLPPVTVPKTEVKPEECELIGHVSNIVNKLSTYLEIMVRALPNKPVFNIDTLLFIHKGKQPLGYIFDVIGQVSMPHYVIRYNSHEEIEDLYVEVGSPVYSAPRTEHSHYVFVPQLMKQKGSDASWKNDCEMPQDYLDFSDDEQDGDNIGAVAVQRNGYDRHKDFEQDMNLRNLIHSQIHTSPDFIGPAELRPGQEYHSQRSYEQPQLQLPPQQQMRPDYSPVSTACVFPQSYHLGQYQPPILSYVPQFLPNIPPPGFPFAGVPPPSRSVQSARYNAHGVQANVVDMYGNMPMMPQAVSPQACMSAPVMYPIDLGLPPPQPPQPTYVPTLPYFNAPPVMWEDYVAPTQPSTPISPGNNQPPTPEPKPVRNIKPLPRFYLPPPN